MIEILVNFLETTILPWGVLGVFVASITEEVFAPIPSALIMSMSGFIFVSGPIDLENILILIFKVAIPASLGVLVGSYFVFFIAKFGGKFVIEKWGKYVGLYNDDIEKLKNRFNQTKRDDFLVFLARIIPFVPSVAISAFCGLIGMDLTRYSVISLAGLFFRSLILGFLGWQVGNIYEKYAHLIGQIESSVFYAILLILFVFFVVKFVNIMIWTKKQPK